MTNKITTDNLLTQLSDNGYTVRRENLPSLANPTSAVAWYQHLLLGVGVFAAFVCFLLLLGVSEFFYLGHIEQSIWAVGFIAVAIGLYRGMVGTKPYDKNLTTVFVTQVTFVLMLSGESLLLYHVFHYFNLKQIWQLTLLAGLITAVTFPLYPVRLSRIISVAVLLFFVQILIPYSEFGVTASVYQSIVFVALFTGLLYLTFSLRMVAWRYLRYAIFATLFINLTFFIIWIAEIPIPMPRIFSGYAFGLIPAIFYPSFIIAIVLCGCVIYLAGEQRKSYGVWLLCVALLVLAYFLPPTLFFALLLMVLGYASHDKVMTGLGLALMPYYLFEYYFDLQWSLLDKSLLLMASGAVLLFVAFAIAKLPQLINKRVGQ